MGGKNEILLSGRADLKRVLESLNQLRDHMNDVGEEFKRLGDKVGDELDGNAKKTESFLDRLKKLSKNVAKEIKKDFSDLSSVGALAAGLKLSSQFKGSIDETVNLSNVIRKLGHTFGVANNDFAKFQTSLTKGLGDIGLSSEVAAKTLEGLSQTQVRGTDNIIEYSKAAGELASIGREQGREGDIANMIARTIQARGGNVNDIKEMKQVSQDVAAVHMTTGMAPSETLKNMESMFTNMSSDFRKTISSRGLATLSGASGVAGPHATDFIQSFLKLGKTQRAGLEARGMGGLFGDKGFNPEQIKKFAAEAQKLGGGDMRLGLKAMGIESDEAAEGFLRLVDNLDAVVDAQNKIQKSNVSLEDSYKSTMGMGEAFNANINKVKQTFAGPLSAVTQGVSNILSKSSKTTGGSIAMVAGTGLLAALLTSKGLRGVGKGLGLGGMAKAKAEEALTGEKVIPVRVVNAEEIGGGGMAEASGLLSKAMPMLGKGMGVLGAGAAGWEVGGLLEQQIEEKTQGKTEEGFEGSALERLFFKLDKLVGGETSGRFMQQQKMIVELSQKEKDFQINKKGSRGASQ